MSVGFVIVVVVVIVFLSPALPPIRLEFSNW